MQNLVEKFFERKDAGAEPKQFDGCIHRMITYDMDASVAYMTAFVFIMSEQRWKLPWPETISLKVSAGLPQTSNRHSIIASSEGL